MNVGRGRRMGLRCAVVIAAGGSGAWYLHQESEPVRAARSSAPAAIPVTTATVTKRDLPIYLTGLGSFQTQQVVDQRQAKVDQLIASINADDAAIETVQTQLDYTSITAPGDGRMGVRMIDPGNIVRWLNDMREAQARGPVEVTALSRDNVNPLSAGTLSLIGNIVDQASATMRLKAMFANEDEKLGPGDFVNARVLINIRRDVLVIPATAVERGPRGIFTWVVKPEDTVEARLITVGQSTGDETIITSGLSEGERIVVDGQYKLRLDPRVTVNQPPASAAAKRSGSS
jgi:membrane fusion protein, multidrug efflux system